jgi:hypothetical protein
LHYSLWEQAQLFKPTGDGMVDIASTTITMTDITMTDITITGIIIAQAQAGPAPRHCLPSQDWQ